MTAPEAGRLTVGAGTAAREIAVLARRGGAPGLLWAGGFRSTMAGTKAEAVDAWAAAHGLAATRFDYSGHGASGGRFEDGTISRWLEEARAVLDTTVGPQVVVGSSMGGWIALLLAMALKGTGRVAGLVLIAPAWDMTRALMWHAMDDRTRAALMERGHVEVPSGYANEPYRITRGLIEDGDRHLFGEKLIAVGCPVHILQGMADTDVPWQHAERLVSQLPADDVVLTLIKDGDHRLSRPADLARLESALAGLVGRATG